MSRTAHRTNLLGIRLHPKERELVEEASKIYFEDASTFARRVILAAARKRVSVQQSPQPKVA